MTSSVDVVLLNPPSKYGVAVVRDTLYGCWCKGRANYNWPPIGLAYIAAVLEEANIKVSILDASSLKYTFKETIQELKNLRSKHILINNATITFSEDLELSALIKNEFKDISITFAGTHVTALPKESLSNEEIDFIIIGEPEYSVKDLILSLEQEKNLKEIPGIGYKDNGKIVLTKARKPKENLEEMPFPARHLIPNAEYFNPLAKRLPYTTLLSSRGCPFKCIFCTSTILYGKKWRARSPENVVDEIEHVIEQYGIKEIFFRDETFSFNRKRVLQICQEIMERELDITWMCNTRVDTVDKELMKVMKSAGCHMLKFGVESGDQQILSNLKKGITLVDTINAFKWAKELDVSTVAHLMLGSPGETKKTIQKTIKFTLGLDPDYASFNITTPYPGTELFAIVEKEINSQMISNYDMEKALESALFNTCFTELTPKEIEETFDKAYTQFYFRPRYILRRIKKQKTLSEIFRLISAGFYLFGFIVKKRMGRT
jgi:radical SAM superfamily enzyme YgiQ (UPF0313 family)